MKYNVGDRVRIVKKWNKDTPENSAGRMDKWLGKVMTIREINGNWYKMKEDMSEHEGRGWSWNEACIEGLAHECNQKIVITSKNGETLARLYDGNKVIKSASAKCCPDDVFDFKFGANLAYERLMSEEKPKSEENPHGLKYQTGDYVRIVDNRCGHDFAIGTIVRLTKRTFDYLATDSKGEEWYVQDVELAPVTWKIVDRPVKKGDYVRITTPCFGFNETGDIMKVFRPHGTGILVLDRDHPRSTATHVSDDFEWCYCEHQFEVVEPVDEKKPEPKPEPKVESTLTFKEGDRVKHYEYGKGTVINKCYDGQYGVEFDEKKGWCHNCDGFSLEWGKYGTKSTSSWCWPSELTLITEKPKKPKKQKYNGKVVCVDLNGFNKGLYTVGKVYQFKDGVLTMDNGEEIAGYSYSPIYTFADWERFSGSKFIEVVE